MILFIKNIRPVRPCVGRAFSMKKMKKTCKEASVFHNLETLISKNPDITRFVLYDRVSHKTQKDHPKARQMQLIEYCEALELAIGGYYWEIAKGYSNLLSKRKSFFQAIEQTQKLRGKGFGVVLVAPSVSRFVRPEGYIYTCQDDPLLKRDIKRFMKTLVDIVPATIIPPDTPYDEERSILTKMGQKDWRKRGGRPSKHPKKAIRVKFAPIAIQLYKIVDEDNSLQDVSDRIFKEYGISISRHTINDWIKKDREDNPE